MAKQKAQQIRANQGSAMPFGQSWPYRARFWALTEKEKVAAFADSAYRDTKRRNKLEDRGVFYGVMHRRVRGQSELTDEQKHHNRSCPKVRGICEMPLVVSVKLRGGVTSFPGFWRKKQPPSL